MVYIAPVRVLAAGSTGVAECGTGSARGYPYAVLSAESRPVMPSLSTGVLRTSLLSTPKGPIAVVRSLLAGTLSAVVGCRPEQQSVSSREK